MPSGRSDTQAHIRASHRERATLVVYTCVRLSSANARERKARVIGGIAGFLLLVDALSRHWYDLLSTLAHAAAVVAYSAPERKPIVILMNNLMIHETPIHRISHYDYSCIRKSYDAHTHALSRKIFSYPYIVLSALLPRFIGERDPCSRQARRNDST